MKIPRLLLSVKFIFPMLFLLAVIGGSTLEAKATTFFVDNQNDSGAGSFRAAVAQANAAPSNDTIEFNFNFFTITLASEIQIDNNGSLTIEGGVLNTIDGGNGNNRIFSINGATVTMHDLILQNGGSASFAQDGSAIFTSGNLTLNGVEVASNTSTGASSAIRLFAGSLTLNQSVVINNTGGGISTTGSTVRINNSTIANNTSINCAGLYGLGNIYLVQAVIYGNTATSGGGGGVCTDNTASNTNIFARNSTIANNSATGAGGGIVARGSTTNGTFGTVNLGNTIVAGNTASSDADISLQANGIVQSVGGNLIGNNSSVGIVFPAGNPNANSDRVGTSGSPLNPGLGPFYRYFLAPTARLPIVPTSPARDSGINANAVDPFNNQPLVTDARNAPRFYNTTVDTGAYEFQGMIVDNTSDDASQSACVDELPNDCSLRAAITNANNAAPDDIINFSVGGGQTITLSTVLPTITTNLRINGPGADQLTVSGADVFRVFIIGGADTNINGITIANGRGGITGGAIQKGTIGNLTLDKVVVRDSTANIGGGIFNGGGTLTILNSAIINNVANTTFGAGAGIEHTGGNLSIINSTVSGNRTTAGDGNGGGILIGSNATIFNSTIADNSAAGAGSAGGILQTGGTVSLVNTLVAANCTTATSPICSQSTTPDVGGAFDPISSYNLIGNAGSATGFFAANQNQTGTGAAPINARLSVLYDNGGTTPTHALFSNSPAIDKGKSSGATTDQRGLTRPLDFASIANAPGGDGADIGAVEMATLSLPTAASVTVSGRVLMPAGQGLVNAIVTLTDQQGNSRSVRTSSFGYFSFADVAVDETVVINVTSKRYTFAPQVVTIYEAISDLNFVANEP